MEMLHAFKILLESDSSHVDRYLSFDEWLDACYGWRKRKNAIARAGIKEREVVEDG